MVDSLVFSLVKIEGINLDYIKGRHVIIVEDMIDTGKTMSKLCPFLETYGTASVAVATLLLPLKNRHAFFVRRIPLLAMDLRVIIVGLLSLIYSL